MRPLEVRRLGVVPYGEGVELQRALVEQRRAGQIPDLLLLLEHPHVITSRQHFKETPANCQGIKDINKLLANHANNDEIHHKNDSNHHQKHT